MIMIKRFIALMFTMLVLGPLPALANEGLIVETLQTGKGDLATANQQISVHYQGKLTDGTVFDASRPRGQPFSFILGKGQVIKGWDLGIEGMAIGEIRRLTIPPELAYGASGAGKVIPPNATLIFEVELIVTAIRDFPEDLMRQFDKVVWIMNIDQQPIWLLRNISFRRTAHRVQHGIHLWPPQTFPRSAPNPPC